MGSWERLRLDLDRKWHLKQTDIIQTSETVRQNPTAYWAEVGEMTTAKRVVAIGNVCKERETVI